MSRRVLLCLATLVSVAWGRSIQAQQATDPRSDWSPEAKELAARLDSLRPLLLEAKVALSAREKRDEAVSREAAAAVTAVDTLQVGLVTIITPIDQVEVARELFTEVWEESFSQIGRSPMLESARFAFQWAGKRAPIHIEENGRDLRMTSWTRRSSVKSAIRSDIGLALAGDLEDADSRTAAWGGGRPFQEHDLESVYRMVATTPSAVTRECLEGDIDSCASAMGLGVQLVDPQDWKRPWPVAHMDQVRAWYTPEERRALVANVGRARTGRLTQHSWRGCVEDGVIAECDRVMEEARSDWTPLDGTVRSTLVAFAIERGGAGAWERLVASGDLAPIEALERTSELSIRELLEGWQAQLLTHRPVTYQGLPSKSGLALVWTLFFAALATRSTRWRSQ